MSYPPSVSYIRRYIRNRIHDEAAPYPANSLKSKFYTKKPCEKRGGYSKLMVDMTRIWRGYVFRIWETDGGIVSGYGFFWPSTKNGCYVTQQKYLLGSHISHFQFFFSANPGFVKNNKIAPLCSDFGPAGVKKFLRKKPVRESY